jgi:hypothetical protein
LNPDLENNWQNKTIENLERQNFGNPDEASTNMAKRCLELCKVPLCKFTIEDLRLMIGQEFSLRYLIPMAISHLKKNIFAEGDFYPGDLLKNVLTINTEFWSNNKHMWHEVFSLIDSREDELAAAKIATTLFKNALNTKK